MFRLLTLTAVLGWLSVPPLLWRLRRALRPTSLAGLWRLLGSAWLLWGAAGIASLARDLPAGTVDLLWYSVAVVMLVPPVAVLGARRPIHRVWPWFVLLPLLLVFAWPVVSAFGRGKTPVMWNIEEPVLVGYGLVLVMGAGNYVGLRYTLPALLWIAALGLLIGPLCPLTAAAWPTAPTSRIGATLLLTAAAWIAACRARPAKDLRFRIQDSGANELPGHRKGGPGGVALQGTGAGGQGSGGGGQGANTGGQGSGVDRVWGDFGDTFGIVWARRVQERFNDEMRRQNLKVRLGIRGLEHGSGASEIPATECAAAEASLRWLLQKFVDAEWIDRRIG